MTESNVTLSNVTFSPSLSLLTHPSPLRLDKIAKKLRAGRFDNGAVAFQRGKLVSRLWTGFHSFMFTQE